MVNQTAIQAIAAGAIQSVTSGFVQRAFVIAIAEANEKVPKLFQRCEYWGKNGSALWLRQSFAGTAISELQKPLVLQLKPDVMALQLSFEQALPSYGSQEAVAVEALEDWLKVFAGEYFKRLTQAERPNVNPWAVDPTAKVHPEQAAAQQLALLRSDDEAVRSRAAEYLGGLGQNAKPMIDRLLALLKDESQKVRDAAIVALLKLEHLSDAVVNEALGASDWQVRCDAAIALGQQGQASERAINTLVALLDDDVNNVRALAASSLGCLGQTSEQISPQMIEVLLSKGLKDRSVWVKVYAASALVELGHTSEIVVDTLIRLLGYYGHPDEGEIVRDCAAESLGHVGHDAERVIDALLVCLEDDDEAHEPICQAAAESLLRLAHAVDGAMDRVVDGLLSLFTNEENRPHEFNDFYYEFVAHQLLKLAESSDAVVDGLLALLKADDVNMRYDIAAALGSLSHASDAVIDGLRALLNDSDEDVRHCAVESLKKLGKAAVYHGQRLE